MIISERERKKERGEREEERRFSGSDSPIEEDEGLEERMREYNKG